MVEFDLLTVETDVVFGSRSQLMCGDAHENAPILLRAGSNVADRCVVLPGVTLGVNACLGSGSLAAKGTSYPSNCVTVGSTGGRCLILDEGSTDATDTAETRKAFARTFWGTKDASLVDKRSFPHNHLNTATWWVPPVQLFVIFVWCCHAFAAIYRAIPVVVAFVCVDSLFGGRYQTTLFFTKLTSLTNTTQPLPVHQVWAGFGWYACVLLGVYIAVHFAMVLGACGIEIGAKWFFMGQRTAGQYPWDSSTYLMRWNCYLAVEVIRKHLLAYIQGSVYLCLYFRALGCTIGRNVCLFPTVRVASHARPSEGARTHQDSQALTACLISLGRALIL